MSRPGFDTTALLIPASIASVLVVVVFPFEW